MANKQHLHNLLADAIPLLCRNGLPPSVSFRVEALIGITVLDDEGRDVIGEGNVTVLSFKQTVSDSGVIESRFGSNDTTAAASDVESTVSHTSRKRPAAKQAPPATSFTVKQEYSVETSVKPEYCAESYPSYAVGHPPVDSTLGEYGDADGAEVEYVGEEGEYVGDEEYYENDGQYYDDGSGYRSEVKFEQPDNSYVEDGGSYVQTEYMAEDYDGHSSAGRSPRSKVAKPRQSAAGAQPGTSRGRKPGGAGHGRGGTRQKAGKTSHNQAAALAV